MQKPKLLLVDNEVDLTNRLARALARRGYEVDTVNEGMNAIIQLEVQDFDVVLLDLNMTGIPGLEVLRTLKMRKPYVEVIILTCDLSVDLALKGMRLGAFDYSMKPPNNDELIEKIDKALERKKIREGNIKTALNDEPSIAPGSDDAWHDVTDQESVKDMEGCVMLALSTFRRSEKAVELAIKRAGESRKLSILHVADINLARYFEGLEHGITSELKDLCEEGVLDRHEKAGREHVRAIVERASKEGLQTVRHSRVGRFAKVCLEFAAVEKPSLIVTTRSQRSEWVRKFFGSPVDEIVAKAACPVIVI